MRSLTNKIIAVLFIAVLVSACAASASDITVSGAWARPTPPMSAEATKPAMSEGMTKTAGTVHMGMDGPVSAIYLVIENKGGTADKLVSASTDVSDVTEIHETKEMEGGMMGMQPVLGGLEVPANGSVTLKPGGYHIMLMKLTKELSVGTNIKLVLTFQSGKQITQDVPVKANP